tara:strand:- start:888 stop:1055 length:168 start_codon:yes stop_codon:yes gene_type:complete
LAVSLVVTCCSQRLQNVTFGTEVIAYNLMPALTPTFLAFPQLSKGSEVVYFEIHG